MFENQKISEQHVFLNQKNEEDLKVIKEKLTNQLKLEQQKSAELLMKEKSDYDKLLTEYTSKLANEIKLQKEIYESETLKLNEKLQKLEDKEKATLSEKIAEDNLLNLIKENQKEIQNLSQFNKSQEEEIKELEESLKRKEAQVLSLNLTILNLEKVD